MPDMTGVHHVSLTVGDLAKSEAWYTRVLGLDKLMEREEDGRQRSILLHPGCGLLITLVSHDANPGGAFSETRNGLDHLSFAVSSREELEAWERHLDEGGVDHSPLTEAEPAAGMRFALVVFRDPDNIQLEMFTMLGA